MTGRKTRPSPAAQAGDGLDGTSAASQAGVWQAKAPAAESARVQRIRDKAVKKRALIDGEVASEALWAGMSMARELASLPLASKKQAMTRIHDQIRQRVELLHCMLDMGLSRDVATKEAVKLQHVESGIRSGQARRDAEIERDRTIHDERAKGTKLAAIAGMTHLTVSAVSKILQKPRP